MHPQQILFLRTRAHCACTCENSIIDGTFSTTGSDILTIVMGNSVTVLFYACALNYLTSHNIFCHSVLLSAVFFFFVFWFSKCILFRPQISSFDMIYLYYLTRDSQIVRITSYFYYMLLTNWTFENFAYFAVILLKVYLFFSVFSIFVDTLLPPFLVVLVRS